MTDLAGMPSIAGSGRRPGRVALLAAALVVSAAGGVALGRAYGAEPAGVESHLVLLLRFMAVCKAAAVAATATSILWRLGRPLGTTAFSAYLAALALMAMAPGMIWSLAAIAPGAFAFHAGLVVFLVTAARDDGIAAGLAARRRRS